MSDKFIDFSPDVYIAAIWSIRPDIPPPSMLVAVTGDWEHLTRWTVSAYQLRSDQTSRVIRAQHEGEEDELIDEMRERVATLANAHAIAYGMPFHVDELIIEAGALDWLVKAGQDKRLPEWLALEIVDLWPVTPDADA